MSERARMRARRDDTGSPLARLRRAGCVVLLAALAGGCETPSIPLPPPGPPEVVRVPLSGQTPGEPPVGVWRVFDHFAVEPFAFVIVYNEATHAGALTRADEEGDYESPIFGGSGGDPIRLWYQVDGWTSRPTCFQLWPG